MTNKEIYERVLEIVDKQYWMPILGCFACEAGVCDLISCYSDIGIYIKHDYPEWEAQKPVYTKLTSPYWWPIDDRESRKEALKKAIALCDQKTSDHD